jgi:hypothetical protein
LSGLRTTSLGLHVCCEHNFALWMLDVLGSSALVLGKISTMCLGQYLMKHFCYWLVHMRMPSLSSTTPT